jgi:hypothetical protein
MILYPPRVISVGRYIIKYANRNMLETKYSSSFSRGERMQLSVFISPRDTSSMSKTDALCRMHPGTLGRQD